ncbi:hypothetical protein SAMN04487983_101595 [Streptomyces sp. yr375]|uniref:hypothetical protein n=1 Tax=Streptomyces sp. yr375 TaxID=1761906 RepID=UPI0008AFB61E|nr:hypothetical protein [Streptomyces sp. yr375]SER37807.1 hypothetical protein SAMN04487983_101595 [Streptomyces sp. yr375]
MKLSKLASATAGIGIALSATVVGIATPAAAATTCTTSISSNQAIGYAKCTGGDTRFAVHRAKVTCVGPRGTTSLVYGKWVSTRSGETSRGVCTTNPVVSGVGVLKVQVETEEPVS